MSWRTRLAFRYVRTGIARNLFTAFGVALGVALATALILASLSTETSLHQQVVSQYGDYDLQFGYRQEGQYLPDPKLEEVKQLPSVEDVSKVLIPYTIHLPEEVRTMPTYRGVESNSPDLQMYTVASGRLPQKGAEVALSKAYAERHGIKAGDHLQLPFPPYGKQDVQVVGILTPPVTKGGADLAFFPLAWLQDTMHLQQQSTYAQLMLAPEVQKGALATELKKRFPGVTVDERSYIDKAYKRLNMYQPMVYGLGVIALLVGAILVMGSFHLSVWNRSNIWAALRAIGASTRDVMRVIVMEAAILGVIGSLLGLFAGVAFSRLVSEVIGRWMDVQAVQSTYSWGAFLLLFVAGVLLSVLGASIPAYTTRNIPPAQVLQLGVSQGVQKERKSRVIGLVLLALGVLLGFASRLFPSGEGGGIPMMASGLAGLLICIGLLLSIPQIIGSTVYVLTPPIRRVFGIEATLATRNVVRYRRRSGFAIATLALGLILAVSANLFFTSTSVAFEETLKSRMPADIVIRTTDTESSLDPAMAKTLSQWEGVDAVAPVGMPVASHLQGYDYNKADPEWLKWVDANPQDLYSRQSVQVYPLAVPQAKQALSLHVLSGASLEQDLQPNEAVVPQDIAKNLGLKVGDTLTVQVPGSTTAPPLRIVSIIESFPVLTGYPYFLVNYEWGMDTFHDNGLQTIQIKLQNDVPSAALEARIGQLLKNKPSAEFVSYQSQVQEQKDNFSRQMLLIQGVIVVILGISGIGLVNSIISSLYDRRNETGMLQAIGATPWQILGIVSMEGVVLGLSGGVTGLIGGSVVGYFLLRALQVTSFVIPWNLFGVLLIISVLLGMLASAISSLWVRKTSPSQAMRML